MRGFAVQRFRGNDGEVCKNYFSLLSPENLSVIENFNLPFNEDDSVCSGNCRSLLYFVGGCGKVVIWNLATKVVISTFPPPVFLPRSEGHCEVIFTGLDYDAKSRDYKFIRYYYVQHYARVEEEDRDIVVAEDYYCDLYSSKFGTWKKLKKPYANESSGFVGVYVVETGRCYWVGSGDGICYYVVSFDFATQFFDYFSLPVTSLHPLSRYKLVELRGSLGAIVYHRLDENSPVEVEVFVRTGTVWDVLYVVSLKNVCRPILGVKDDRVLFLMGEQSRYPVAYDLVTKTLKKLDINDCTVGNISYVETTDPSKKKKKKKKKTKQQQQQQPEKEKEKKAHKLSK